MMSSDGSEKWPRSGRCSVTSSLPHTTTFDDISYGVIRHDKGRACQGVLCGRGFCVQEKGASAEHFASTEAQPRVWAKPGVTGGLLPVAPLTLAANGVGSGAHATVPFWPKKRT